ncbi:SAM domain and HD [Actinomortierella ambigua]|nr:SAM domain and HD [Actinomortierella ambigua]
MRWEDYEDWEREDAEAALYQAAGDDPEHTIQSLDVRSLENNSGLNRFGRPHRRHLRYDLDFSEMAAYQRQFEGTHDANHDSDRTGILDAYRESVGEQVAKARRAMEKNRQILQSFEEELEAVQLAIDKNMEECNTTRTAVEENFWRLEDLALNLEKDRQEITKQIQTVSREGSQAVEVVTGWQVRIDWLGQQVDNTSSYVSELVLSEQECMSFVRMLVYQNQQYSGAPLISHAARQRIERAAPPQPVSKLAIPESPSSTTLTTTTTAIETDASQSEVSSRSKGKQRADSRPSTPTAGAATPPQQPQQEPTLPLYTRHPALDLSRDFSRLTVALEQRQSRQTYSLFRRARSNSTGGSGGVGAYHPAQLRRPFVNLQRGHQAYAQAQAQMRSEGRQSPSPSTSSSSKSTKDARPLSANEKTGTLPQLDNLTGLPKIIPLATFDAPTIPASAAPSPNIRIKRVSTASLPPVPMHSWIRFQFNKIVGSTSGDLMGTPPGAGRFTYRSGSVGPYFDREDFGIYDGPFEKYINDPIHGHILLDLDCLKCIDTPQFQRLRDLKQLGSAYYVFPGATHQRFEHSIGTSHLAGELVERFRHTQPELEITPSDVKCVKLAGLCHDLGHGPFSHIFDNEFIPRARPGLQWTHEQGSEMMLDYMIEDNNIDIEKEEVAFIKDLIMGERRGSSRDRPGFLFDIVSNKRNSLDVDKYDYIQRDCYNVGIRSSIDGSRLMKMSRVIDDEICWHHKEVYNLYELYHTRFSLFKRVYTHKVGKAIEYMITDAMLEADSNLNISSAIDSPEDYLYLTDDILRQIERSKDPGLDKARGIIKRIRTRNLYKFVDELLIPRDKVNILTKDRITPFEIASCQGPNDNLEADDIIIEFLKNNYAMKDRNPVDGIKFFSKHNYTTSYHIPREKVSSLIPSEFQECSIRVFVRDPAKVRAVHEAFRRLMSRFFRDLPPSTTSPYFDTADTTPEKGGNGRRHIALISSRGHSPSPAGDPLNHKKRQQSPTPLSRRVRPMTGQGDMETDD